MNSTGWRGAMAVAVVCGLLAPVARGGDVTVGYTPLTEGSTIDLTAEGTLDWVKFGNGEHDTGAFFVATKIGNLVFLPATLAATGDGGDSFVELIAFTGGNVLNFSWSDGNFGMYNEPGPVDTVVTETLNPPDDEYPIGLGATFQATAIAQTRTMNVYVQAFNAPMLITASMSGGGEESITVSPDANWFNPASDPGNDYAAGRFSIDYSGAGELLTVSVQTLDPRTDGTHAAFANAGFFAASVAGPVPEPSTLALLLLPLAATLRLRRGAA